MSYVEAKQSAPCAILLVYEALWGGMPFRYTES